LKDQVRLLLKELEDHHVLGDLRLDMTVGAH
jgi:hypothetical protein